MDILENIPIKPICQIVSEYFHHPRSYLYELHEKTFYIKSKIDNWICGSKDAGCTTQVIIKGNSCNSYKYDLGFPSENKFNLYNKENERRISLGLKTNAYIFGIVSCSATNRCYIGY